MPSGLFATLPTNWSVIVAVLCLITIIVVFILTLTMCSRQSVSDMYDRALFPTGTEYQRSYWRSCYERRNDTLFKVPHTRLKPGLRTSVLIPTARRQPESATGAAPSLVAGPLRQIQVSQAPPTGMFAPVFAPKIPLNEVERLLDDLEAGHLRPLRPDIAGTIHRSGTYDDRTSPEVQAGHSVSAAEKFVQRPALHVPQRNKRVKRRSSAGGVRLSSVIEGRDEEGYEMQSLQSGSMMGESACDTKERSNWAAQDIGHGE